MREPGPWTGGKAGALGLEGEGAAAASTGFWTVNNVTGRDQSGGHRIDDGGEAFGVALVSTLVSLRVGVV
jgi:hypothetical protein